MSEMLKACTKTVEITPPTGSMMSSFPRGPERKARRALGAHDPLYVRVLALRGDNEPVIVCACDLCIIRDVDVERIRRKVVEQIPGLAADRIIITTSHTHSSVESSYLSGNTPDDPWIHEMNQRIACAVVDACQHLIPVTCSVGRTTEELNHNRRVMNSEGKSRMVFEYTEGVTVGTTDPEMIVLRFDGKDGRPAAVLYNFTAHALTAGPKNDYYTADYPGVTSGVVEKTWPGCTALFCNGAAGNIHPRRCMRDNFSMTAEIGTELGTAVVEAVQSAEGLGNPELAFTSKKLMFPNRVDPSLQVEVEISCLRLGNVIMGFVPGEPYVEFQLSFKEQVRPLVGVFVGYSNAWTGYLPTLDDYAHGGYGVDQCSIDAAHWSRTALPQGTGERILTELVALADTVRK
ncbi:hypothetical protein ACFLQL_04250 [Verrucomicrobiota bacterium]